MSLAGLRMLNGELDEARVILREAVAVLVESQSPMMTGMALAGHAILANRDGDAVRTARLMGAMARMNEESGTATPPFVLTYFGDPEASARAELDADAFERAYADGYAMGLNQARAYAIELSQLNA